MDTSGRVLFCIKTLTLDYLNTNKINNLKKFIRSYNLINETGYLYADSAAVEREGLSYDYIFFDENGGQLKLQHTTQSEQKGDQSLTADENIMHSRIIPNLESDLRTHKINVHLHIDFKQYSLRKLHINTFISDLRKLIVRCCKSNQYQEIIIPDHLDPYINSIDCKKADELWIAGFGITMQHGHNAHLDLDQLIELALIRKDPKAEGGVILLVDLASDPTLSEDRYIRLKSRIDGLVSSSQWLEIWAVNDYQTEAFKLK